MLQLALSAVVRQTSDGRLSQQINDALDGAALDGASAGSAVLIGDYMIYLVARRSCQNHVETQGHSPIQLGGDTGRKQPMLNSISLVSNKI